MSLTIRQHRQLTQSRGRNDLLDSAYRNLGRSVFIRDLIATAAIAVVIVIVWRVL